MFRETLIKILFRPRAASLTYLGFLCLIMFFGFPASAWAYIDPATTSYIIQIVSGLIISLSVVFGVFFRSFQMFLVTLRARLSAFWVRLTSQKHRDRRRESARKAKTDARAVAQAAKLEKANNSQDRDSTAAARTMVGQDSEQQTIQTTNQAGVQAATKANTQTNTQFDNPFAPLRPLRPHQVPPSARASASHQPGGTAAAAANATNGATNSNQKQRSAKESFDFLFRETRPFKKRLAIAALLALGLSFTLILFGVLDMFVANRNILPYPMSQLIGLTLLLFAITFVVLTIIMSLPRGRVFDYIASFFLGLLLIFYIQGNFLNSNMGQLNGNTIPWDWYLDQSIYNTLACGLIMLVPFIVRFFSAKAWNVLVLFVPALLVFVQAIALITSMSTSGVLSEAPEKLTYLSDQGIYQVAQKDNTIVFLLDRLDSRYVEQVVKADPSFFEGQLDGFTKFTNNVTLHSRTYPSVINMLTADNYFFEYPAEDFAAEAWQSAQFLPALKAEGYTSKIYTEKNYGYFNAEDLRTSADNIETGELIVDQPAAFQKLVILSCYRYMPHVLKAGFWLSTDYFYEDVSYDGEHNIYTTDDYKFYRGLVEQKITVNDRAGNFAYYHLNGSHAPFYLNDNLERVPSEESSSTLQTRAAFKIVFEYINQLKKLGLYEDATIIITGDHGYASEGYTSDWHQLQEAQVTALFVKPTGASGVPTVVSNAPVAIRNFQPTILEAAGIKTDPSTPGYLEVAKDSKEPRQFFFRVGEAGVTEDNYLQEFAIVGDANNFRNWTEVARHPIKYWHA